MFRIWALVQKNALRMLQTSLTYGQHNCLQEISFLLLLAALAINFGVKPQHIFTRTKHKPQERLILQVTYNIYNVDRLFLREFMVSDCSEEAASRWRFNSSSAVDMGQPIKLLDSTTLLTEAIVYNVAHEKNTLT